MTGETKRTCRVCRRPFTWTAVQADWLRRRVEAKGAAYFPPNVCPRCQAEEAVRRDPSFRVEICCNCGEPFAAGPSLTRPGVLCRACWDEKRSAKAP